jgi:hypothetical protein
VHLAARRIVYGGLGLLAFILPGPVRAACTCPPKDNLGFPLGQSDESTDPIFCSYPAVPGEDPNDFFCTYNSTTGQLVEDHDAGLCPATANCSGPTSTPTTTPLGPTITPSTTPTSTAPTAPVPVLTPAGLSFLALLLIGFGTFAVRQRTRRR